MAVLKIPVSFRLVVRFMIGLVEGVPAFRNRAWNNVKPTVSADDLHQLGTYIGQLCDHTVNAIYVDETFELED